MTSGHCADHPHAFAQWAPVGTVVSVAISFFGKKSELGTHCLMDLVMEITCGLSPLLLLTKHGLP